MQLPPPFSGFLGQVSSWSRTQNSSLRFYGSIGSFNRLPAVYLCFASDGRLDDGWGGRWSGSSSLISGDRFHLTDGALDSHLGWEDVDSSLQLIRDVISLLMNCHKWVAPTLAFALEIWWWLLNFSGLISSRLLMLGEKLVRIKSR